MRPSLLGLRPLVVLSFGALGALGCSSGAESDSADITDVAHTDVEQQPLGNCWLYAEASWVESMHLSATGEKFDTSQSYWTYWHWFDQIRTTAPDQINPSGVVSLANKIIAERGLMAERDFIPEDAVGEMSLRQQRALDATNRELKDGRLRTREARQDAALVVQVLNDAFQLGSAMKTQLATAFGKDGSRTIRDGSAQTGGTSILKGSEFKVQYTERSAGESKVRTTTLDSAMADWRTHTYPSSDLPATEGEERQFLIRVQRALHDRQPLVITWSIDFNAMADFGEPLAGSFNLKTLLAAGPGSQGAHMTVLEDYQATTEEFGVLKAGITLDPTKPADKAKLDAALLPSSRVEFFRVKNSWGALRDDRASAPGFPGYHDLYMDYLDGPIPWCPRVQQKTKDNCTGTVTPFSSILLPPGY